MRAAEVEEMSDVSGEAGNKVCVCVSGEGGGG